MVESREDSVYLAKLAEQAERYEEMVEHTKAVASSDQELTVEERNLLSVAYKNVIGSRRASWRIASSIEQKEESKGNDHRVSMIKTYRTSETLHHTCRNLFQTADAVRATHHLLNGASYLSSGEKIESELAKICDDILEVLDKHLIPSAKSGESKVFYYKMFVWQPVLLPSRRLVPPWPMLPDP